MLISKLNLDCSIEYNLKITATVAKRKSMDNEVALMILFASNL
jgi:hypothetical protein